MIMLQKLSSTASIGALVAAALSLAACATVQPAPQAHFEGSYRHHVVERTAEASMRAHVITVDLTQPGVRFGVTPADNSQGMEHTARLTSGYLEETGAKVAINASYFLPFKGGSEAGHDYYPHVGQPVSVSGAAISGGQQVSPPETHLDERVDSIICFDQARVTIENGQLCPQGFTDGVAAGPRLIEAGQPRAFSGSYSVGRHPRTAMGISEDGKTAWIVVVDGRQSHSEGANLQELTDLFVELGASSAINLDGGGSSTLAVAAQDGRAVIVNSPIHTRVPGRERPVANHVVLFAGDSQ